MRSVRVALVGCGAVARANLLPVLAGHERVALTALVDRDEARAHALAGAYGVPAVLTDLDALTPDRVDAVVLATPPAHHAPATLALAGRGLHVFVEKPMATRLADAEAMVAAADRAGVVLAVGLYRRFLPSVGLLRHLVASGEFGTPRSIDIEEGGAYGWQLATLDVLTRAAGGGGVLIDIGSHLLDELLFIVPGRPGLGEYRDNARGGVETDCVLQGHVETDRGQVPVRMELSRTRNLRNSIRVECEEATLELHRSAFTEVVVHRASAERRDAGSALVRLTAQWSGQDSFIGYQAFRDEIDDWLTAITTGAAPALSGRSVLPVVGLIEACYGRRADLPEAWTDERLKPDAAPAVRTRRGKRVLVTGAGGFLGGRTVEVLRERHGWDVRALVRAPHGAARLARWPAEIVIGDVSSAADMERAVAGCDAVVHCAVGTTWPPDAARRVTVEGTRITAEAARRAGVRRFVHISTLFVHRRDVAGVLNEDVPLEPRSGDHYGQAKLSAEHALAEVARHGLSTIVLRPTRIYGPFSKTFTVRPLEALAAGRLAIGGDPDVPANMVYVDSVVEAIARALDAPEMLSGSAYLVNDVEQPSLHAFYEYFARAAGLKVPVVPDRADGATPRRSGFARRSLDAMRSIATSTEFRGFVRRVLYTDPIGTLPRRLWERSPRLQNTLLRRFGADAAVVYRPSAAEAEPLLIYTGERARVSAAKAERELGFSPPVAHDRALALTLDWARYARLLPDRSDPRA